MINSLSELKDELFSCLELKKKNRLYNVIETALKTGQLNVKSLADILGEIIPIYSEYFTEKVYQTLLKRVSKFVNLYQLDLYILKKFCLLEGEEIIANCMGTVTIGKIIHRGRIYLTNMRIIVSGFRLIQPSGGMFMR